jgi:hypothetical protein
MVSYISMAMQRGRAIWSTAIGHVAGRGDSTAMEVLPITLFHW